MLSDSAVCEDAKPALVARAQMSNPDLEAFREMLDEASAPMMIVGGGGWDADTSEKLQRFSEANNIPVLASFRCQDYFDNAHPNYCGHAGIGINPKTAERIRNCDLLISVGSRLGEITTSGYSLINIPNPQMKLVHVYAGAEELGHVYRPDLGINAASSSFADAVTDLQLPGAQGWADWTREAAQEYRASMAPKATPGSVQLEQVVAYVSEHVPDDTLICNGAGNYAAWVNRYYRYRQYRTQLAPTSGSMGYGLPAAVAAQLAHRDRRVVCFAGDGCFLMTGQEMATAAMYELPLIVIVANNGMFGTIRMHQERHYPARVHGTGLQNPDFAMLGQSYGAHGALAQTNAEFEAAFNAALERKGPTLIELTIDPNALSPAATLEEVRQQGLASQQ
jgi:acetolactate synthase-1/2/3 large subunit